MSRPYLFRGVCIGGPKAGQGLVAQLPVIKIARVEQAKIPPIRRMLGSGIAMPPAEIGHYEWDDVTGHWWWRGFEREMTR